MLHSAGLTGLTELNIQGCRNICNSPGLGLAGLGSLTRLACLNMRNCDGLSDGALGPLSALAGLHSLDLSGCQHLSGSGCAPTGGCMSQHANNC